MGNPDEIKQVAKAVTQLEIEYRNIEELIDYEFNPRDNADAIESVRASIRQFGFINPVVIDDDDVIIVGHTRRAAGRLEGITRVPTIKASHLSESDIRAFRIVDNKVGEIANWNYDLLAQEIAALAEQEANLDMTLYGFKQEQIDCLSEMVLNDCLVPATVTNDVGGNELGEGEGTGERVNRPATTRFVIGEFVLHLPTDVYQAWAREIREDCEFSAEAISQEILRRLGVELDG
ncbi:MAG: ParB N-terminal domain-containing protein [Shewanella sp.]|nr:ParB N-terminal domain-containing protein [Shewanella sp.]